MILVVVILWYNLMEGCFYLFKEGIEDEKVKVRKYGIFLRSLVMFFRLGVSFYWFFYIFTWVVRGV